MNDSTKPAATPLAERIAASIEDVQTLLNDNRSLSVAFLARRIRDLEDDMRRGFRERQCSCADLKTVQAEVEKLKHRIEQARVKFKEMREDVDKLKQGVAKSRGV